MYYKFKLPFAFLLSLLLMTSCGNETDNLITDETTIDNFGERRGGPRGGGNGNDGDGPVTQMSHTIATDWMNLFIELDRYATGMRPNATARAIAYIGLAAYETAIPGMRDYRSNENRLDGLNLDRPGNERDIKYALALNAAYADVIDHFLLHLPADKRNQIEDFEQTNFQALSQQANNREIEASLEWGSYVAGEIIAYSQTDAEAEAQVLEPQPTSYEPPVGEGYWTYSADAERGLFPYWKSVRTFVITPDETSTIPPVPYNENPGSNYFNQMREVYQTNNRAKELQNEELWIAEFWSDDVEGLMMSPPGRQVSIANQLIENENLNLDDALELYLKLGFSLNDAAVSTWADKYEYMVMRPNVFIHKFIDPAFQTNLYKFIYWPNPTFPGYPSGHSCFASAAAGVFIDEFGNNTRFTDLSHDGRTEFLGDARTFRTLSEMAEENAYSRIPLGVHIRMDCTEGLRLGYEISDAVNNLSLKRSSS